MQYDSAIPNDNDEITTGHRPEVNSMKWFKTVFLPSLEERYNQRNGKMWLTVKQTNVCKDYMTYSNTVRGSMYMDIGEKRYAIQIAQNGCACLHILVNGWIVSHT